MLFENSMDETSWARGMWSWKPILTVRIIVQPSRDNRRPREDFE